jgi:hypothetical protein
MHAHTYTHTQQNKYFFCSTQNSASQPVSCCRVPFNKISQLVLIALRFGQCRFLISSIRKAAVRSKGFPTRVPQNIVRGFARNGETYGLHTDLEYCYIFQISVEMSWEFLSCYWRYCSNFHGLATVSFLFSGV